MSRRSARKVWTSMLGRRPIIIAFSLAVFIVSLAVGIYLRTLPYSNYAETYNNALKLGLSQDVAKYAYITANDPWITYWLADYLHKHGISSWTGLTRSNPDTHIFWYPWGRDISEGEYPFIPVIGSLPPDGLDVVRWVSLIPAVFGATLVAAVYAVGWLLWGPIPAAVGSVLAAVLPASVSRTYVGFVEKIGVAMPFLVVGLGLLVDSVRRRSTARAVAAGAVLGSIAFIWGGYALGALAVASAALLVPLAVPSWRDELGLFKILAASAAALAAVSNLADAIDYGKVSPPLTLLPLAAVAAAAALSYLIGRAVKPSRFRRAYFGALLVIAAVGIVVAPKMGLGGRYYFTILWPLRLAGVIELGRLPETVAEHAAYFNPARPQMFREFLDRTNIVGVLTPVAAAVGIYYAIARRRVELLPLHLTAAGLYYGVLGMAYLLQVSSVVGVLAVTSLVALVWERKPSERGMPRKRARSRSEAGDLRMAVLVTLLLSISIGSVYAYHESATSFSRMVSTAFGYSTSFQNYGWPYFLEWLTTNTTEDTVVVTWWDYGYWISVGSGRPTLADGATSNSTQIELLAKFFTSTNMSEALDILRKLKLEPGRTLVMVHDNVLLDPVNGTVVYTVGTGLPSIDIAKSSAMLYIAKKTDLGFAVGNDKYKQTLIYKMFASAPFYIREAGSVFPPVASGVDLQRLLSANVTRVLLFGEVTEPFDLGPLKPRLVIVAPYLDSSLKPVTFPSGGSTYYFAMLIAVYEWSEAS